MDLPRIELLSLIFLPLAGASAAAILGPQRKDQIRWLSLGITVISLLLALHLAGQLMTEIAQTPSDDQRLTFKPYFVPGSPGTFRDPGLARTHADPHGTSWDLVDLGRGVIQFYVGLDGLNVWLVVLTAVLSVSAVLVSWHQIEERPNEFYAWLLALQTAMMGIFLAFDIILFYVFFEFSLVPLFFLIGIWGGPERRHAAGKFFIYTLTGSLIALLGVIGISLAYYLESPHERTLLFSIPQLVEIVQTQLASARPNPAAQAYWSTVQFWVFLALTAGFAVKVPLVPLHTWLPLAHVEAPTAGSVHLAGVLLKIGVYGFLRLCVPLAPDASLALGLPLISTLAAIGVIYGAFCSYAQEDIKKMVAYSSVSHLGMCMIGLFALNAAGLAGSVLQMINHGLSTGALFLLVGMLYERYHTRKMGDYGGMAGRLPLLGTCTVFICLTSVGLPGLNGFIGEILILAGAFQQQYVAREQFPWYAVAGAASMLLGAWYLFTMLQRVFFGALKEPEVVGHYGPKPITDLNLREIAALTPILVLCLLIGVYPQPLLDTMKSDIATVERMAQRARERAGEGHGKLSVGFAEREDQP